MDKAAKFRFKTMNKIETLIEVLCPDGVEFKELGEVCKFKRGSSITKITH